LYTRITAVQGSNDITNSLYIHVINLIISQETAAQMLSAKYDAVVPSEAQVPLN